MRGTTLRPALSCAVVQLAEIAAGDLETTFGRITISRQRERLPRLKGKDT